MKPLLIHVHIPKTGGTSLRYAMDAQIGEGRSLYDYGTAARITSKPVLEWVYRQKDIPGFAEVVMQGGYLALSGHFPLSKYLAVFPDANFVTWVREPVARVWSAFRHYSRHHGYEGAFGDFYREPRFINEQSRILSPSAERLDFIGVTEHYALSVKAFNERFGIAIAERRANRSPELGPDETPPTPSDCDHIRALNEADLDLYHSAVAALRNSPASSGGGARVFNS